MNRSLGLLTVAALGLGAWTSASAYTATADVTFTWASTGHSIGWTSNGVNTFPDPTGTGNTIQVSTTPGNNSTTYYNPDFAIASDYDGATTNDDCATAPANYETISLRKYACRITDAENYYSALYHSAPLADVGPAGAAATGTLTVDDTTMTGTLHVITTTDEPTGGTTVLFNGVNIGTSSGNGADGYNIRTADGSPFGNAWYGVTTSATLQVALTGTFNDTTWTIDGGAVTLTDPAFACQQGGFGGDARGTLCTPSATGGGFQANGAHLSWGMDLDGIGTGHLTASPFEIKDVNGINTLATMSGVIASLALDAGGNITTNSGEFRFALGSAGGGCFDHIRWGGDTDPTPGGTSIGISCGTLSAGDLEITGTATTGTTTDVDPDAFSFAAANDVPLSTVEQSNTITPVGYNSPAPISVTGGEYSIGCTATFVSTAGTINPAETVCVRHTSAATNATGTTTTLTIGATSGDFTSTTVAAGDPDPDAFSFTTATGVAVSTVVTSNTITPVGYDTASAISVTGGEYSIGCTATFVSTAGTINPAETVCVRHTSSASAATDTVTTLTIGATSGTFTSTTAAASDPNPDAFSFTPATNAALSTLVTSNTVTPTGYNAAGAISVTGGEYSIGCTATFVSTAGTINPGETVCVRHTTSASFATDTVTTLTIGTTSGTFTSTTAAQDTTPNAFSFTPANNVALATVVESNTITVSGINSPATLALSGDASSECSVNGGAYSATCAATVDDGDTVSVRHTSSSSNDADVTTTLTIGGIAANFVSTTEPGGTGLRADDGGSSLDALVLALLGVTALARRRR